MSRYYQQQVLREEIEENIIGGLKNENRILKNRLKKFAKDMEAGDEAIYLLGCVYESVELDEIIDKEVFTKIKELMIQVGIVKNKTP